MLKFLITITGSILISNSTIARDVEYPYPISYFNINIEKREVRMAYMHVKPANPNSKTIVLFHGKNFNGFYWKDVIPYLTNAGYRVIVPDQVGWGKSSRPDIHYSFHLLANNTKLLLDSLGINDVFVIAHSMGGMLAIRFTLMFPKNVKKLILENPIGLEDYKTFVPYKTINELYKSELGASYESYKKYQQSYYPTWKNEYEIYVKAQAEDLTKPDFTSIAWVNAITYQMIYEQPVSYEFRRLSVPAMFIIGQADRTIVGKNLLSENEKNNHGNYPVLGRQLKADVKGSTLIELPGVGHIPHIQATDQFIKYVLSFLR